MKALLLALLIASPIACSAASVAGCEDIARTVRDTAQLRENGIYLDAALSKWNSWGAMHHEPIAITRLRVDIARKTYDHIMPDDDLERGILMSCLKQPY